MEEDISEDMEDENLLDSEDEVQAQWNLYFPDQELSPNHEATPIINALSDYFEEFPEMVEPGWHINYQRMVVGESSIRDSQSFSLQLFEQPELVLNAMGLAISQLLFTRTLPASAPIGKYEKIFPKIYNFPLLPFRAIKSNSIGRLISTKGTVIRVGSIKPIIQS